MIKELLGNILDQELPDREAHCTIERASKSRARGTGHHANYQTL